MKLEAGTKPVSEVPKDLEVAARSLSRACHTVKFFKSESGIFYAIGQVASACMADIYLRYEKVSRRLPGKEFGGVYREDYG